MTITIEQVAARIPEWRGRCLVVSPLSGGLTNTNYRVVVERWARATGKMDASEFGKWLAAV